MPDAPTIVTLSSIPPRFAHLGPTLHSLLSQVPAPDAVWLILPDRYRRFPDWDGTLPVLPPGVRLVRGVPDQGPATKILPAVRDLRGQAVDLVLCDDDRIYPPGWLAALKRAAAERPRHCIAAQAIHLPPLGRTPRAPHRMPRMARWTPEERAQTPGLPLFRQSGYADQFEGWAGALVRPDFFGPGVDDIPPVLWAVDDTWLSGALEVAGIPIWLDTRIPRPVHRAEVGQIHGLLQSVIEGANRVEAEALCIRHYQDRHGIWLPPRASALRRLVRRLLPDRLRSRLVARFPALSRGGALKQVRRLRPGWTRRRRPRPLPPPIPPPAPRQPRAPSAGAPAGPRRPASAPPDPRAGRWGPAAHRRAAAGR